MEPALFTILLLGCGDGAASCEPIARAPMTFASATDCETAIDEALEAATLLDHPEVAAECMTVRKVPATLRILPMRDGVYSQEMEIAAK